MNSGLRFLALSLVTLLPACATLIEGTSDNVTLSSNPAGAACVVDRNGERVGAVSATPQSVRISKSRHDLVVNCTKEGYQPATKVASSSFTGTTFGNILAGGLVGVAVDAASGANSKYPSEVNVPMAENPKPEVPPQPIAMEPVESNVQPVVYRPRRRPGV
ncbi:hypothetical protein DOO78_15660 [Roseicella frigidaeris]|uniref:Uncharacterized protein n=2 Tax=Roseicella frigidaeris TaxID=2230885 RepID=A0A327M6T6_9PROT|nr:hypothetical protein DOO78_15660 [Roseicella frigidaeris]